ncbi:hypothetical protein GQ457_01G047510 [Hibiscus cannabinus]
MKGTRSCTPEILTVTCRERERKNGDSSRAVDLGGSEEEQLFLGEAIRKRNCWSSIQQRAQQSLQSQFLQTLWVGKQENRHHSTRGQRPIRALSNNQD